MKNINKRYVIILLIIVSFIIWTLYWQRIYNLFHKEISIYKNIYKSYDLKELMEFEKIQLDIASQWKIIDFNEWKTYILTGTKKDFLHKVISLNIIWDETIEESWIEVIFSLIDKSIFSRKYYDYIFYDFLRNQWKGKSCINIDLYGIYPIQHNCFVVQDKIFLNGKQYWKIFSNKWIIDDRKYDDMEWILLINKWRKQIPLQMEVNTIKK